MRFTPTNGETTMKEVPMSSFPKGIKIPASIISYIFHPFFIPLIGIWMIVETHYLQFAGFDRKALIHLYGSIVTNTTLLPFFTLFMLTQLKFISGFSMPRRRDRIIPYIALMTFYIWTYLEFKKQLMIPEIVKVFLLGIFISSILGFISNIKTKVSLHCIGMGSLIGLVISFFGQTFIPMIIPITAVIFVAGLISSCRLIVANHTYPDIYMGLLFGVFAQLLAFWIL